MNRSYFLGSLLAIPAIVLFLTAVPGCTKKDADKPKDGTASKDTGAKDKEDGEKKAEPLTAKLDGVVKGKVVYDGTPPERKDIDMKGGDAAKCMAGPHKDQTWIVGKDNGVANVVVYLEAPTGKAFAVDDALVKKSRHDATIDQPHCVFEPHVVALFLNYRDANGTEHPTGAKLVVKNSGGISHNTKISTQRNGVILNQIVDPRTEEGIVVPKVPYQGPKYPIAVDCDKHSWMHAEVLTFNNPYFAVTNENGEFEIKNVPTGVDLTVKMWHEKAGVVAAGKESFKTGDNTKDLKIGSSGK